jgi:phage shock protein A
MSVIGYGLLGVFVAGIVVWLAWRSKKNSIAGRVGNVVEGKLDRAVEGLEESDPDAVFRSAINDAEREIESLYEVEREMTGLAFQEKESINDLEGQVESLKEAVDAAAEQENEELGVKCLSEIESIEEEIEGHKEQHKLYSEQAEETGKLRKERMEAKKELEKQSKTANNLQQAAEVVDRVNKAKAGISNTSIDRSLEIAKKTISKSKATLHASKSAEANSTEAQIEKLKKDGANSASKKKFKEMMAAKKKQKTE